MVYMMKRWPLHNRLHIRPMSWNVKEFFVSTFLAFHLQNAAAVVINCIEGDTARFFFSTKEYHYLMVSVILDEIKDSKNFLKLD